MPQFPDCLRPDGHSRRQFLQVAAASSLVLSPGAEAADAAPNVLGQMPGYSPQVGVLVSEMTWMRGTVLRAVKGMTVEQLDFLLDNKANRIGALLLHLAATEKLYQLNTFDNVGARDPETNPAFKDWTMAMNLGEADFRKRDDKWLLTADANLVWGPTNNLRKWFHVCEHESHHTGQISLRAVRTPGAKPSNG